MAKVAGLFKYLGDIVERNIKGQKEKQAGIQDEAAGKATMRPLESAEAQKAIAAVDKMPKSFFDRAEQERIAPIYQSANHVATAVNRQISKGGGQLTDDAIGIMRARGLSEQRISYIQENKIYEEPILIKREMRKAMVSKDRQTVMDGLTSETSNYYSAEQLRNISNQRLAIRNKYANDADMSIKEEYKLIKSYRDSAVKIIQEKGGLQKKQTDIDQIMSWTTNISSKISDYAEQAAKAGLKSVRDQAMKLHNYMRYASPVETKLGNLYVQRDKEFMKWYDKYGKDKNYGMFIRDYIENINAVGGLKQRPATVLADGTQIGSIEINEVAMRDAANAHGVKLTADLMQETAELGVLHQNLNRTKMKVWRMFDDGRYSEASEVVPMSLSELPRNIILDKTGKYGNSMVGDIGLGYMARVNTPEWATARRLKNFGDMGVLNSEEGMGSYVNSVMARQSLERKWEDGKWLDLIEELKHESTTGLSMMFKTSAYKELRGLNGVSKVMGPAGNEGALPQLDNINQNFKDIFAFRRNEASGMTELITLMTDLNKKAFLSNPMSVSLNLFQVALNNVTKNPYYILKSFLGNTGSIVRLVSLNHQKALDSILKNEGGSELTRYCRQAYLRNYYPEAWAKARLDVEWRGDAKWGDSVREFTNALTFFFESADVITRVVAADATAMSVENALKRHAAKKGTSVANYIADMSKDLSIGTMDYAEQHRLTNMMLGDDRRFASEYVNTVLDLELFNYNKLNRPQFTDKAKFNRLTGEAAAFMSYPFYFKKLAMGVFQAAEGGDFKPMARMAGTFAVFYGLAQESTKSNDPMTKAFGNYLSNNTMSTWVFPLSMASRPVAGVLQSTFNQISAPILYGMKEANTMLGTENQMINMMYSERMRAVKGHPFPKLYKLAMKEWGPPQ